jgi:filamentous hemagglutinin family protein
MMKKTALLFSLAVLLPPLCFAGPNIPGFYGKVGPSLPPVAPNALPASKAFIQGVDRLVEVPGANKAVLYQNQPKAIIDWNSFNIGRDAWMHFDQKGNSEWAALNRIWDRNPSQIFGRLTADGHVYLINQNGILFWPGAKVNVHSLIASSLNLQDENFIGGILKFKAEDFRGAGDDLFFDRISGIPGAVSNHGLIQTDELGSVFLIAPSVENSGVIISPVGQIGLIAATHAEIFQNLLNTSRTAPVVLVKGGPGEATNFENGWLIADTGLVGMYGRLVNQEGLIRSITAVKKAGAIELHASERISTGPKSLTSTLVSDSTEAVNQSFVFHGGTVDLGGLMQANYGSGGNLTSLENTATPRIEHRGSIEGASGVVSLRAVERVYLETGSIIDVSGTWVDKTADVNLKEAQLNSVQLRDDYGQKDGLLKALKITFDSLYGSAIGDVSGSLTTQDVTAREQSTKGGVVTIDAGFGDVILKDAAEIRFSGGGLRYGAGPMDTTRLLSGTKAYDIASAPEWVRYDKVLNVQQVNHQRYGINEQFQGLFTGGANEVLDYRGARVQGSDAGSLNIAARRVVLDGRLDGSVVKGFYQTGLEEKESVLGNQNSLGIEDPRGGMLVLGVAPSGAPPSTQDFRLDEVIIKPSVSSLAQGFGPADPLSPADGMGSGGPSATILSAKKLNDAGLGRLEVYANTRLRIDEGAEISIMSRRFLTDLEKNNNSQLAGLGGGYFAAAARRIENFGSVSVPGGEINLSLRDNVSSYGVIGGRSNPLYRPVQQRIFLGGGSRLTAAGEQIDNSRVAQEGTLRTGQTKGGTIALQDGTASGEGVIISKAALIDVSGGYEIDQKGKAAGGDGGSLTIGGSALVLEGTLKGLSLPGKKGGSITLSAAYDASITSEVGSLELNADSPLPQERRNKLLLGQSQFDDTGFAHIAIESSCNLTVERGISLSPSSAKKALPVAHNAGGNGTGFSNDLSARGTRGQTSEIIHVLPETISSSSLKLVAGKGISSIGDAAGIGLMISDGTRLSVFPGGSVDLQGPGVTVEGATIEAPAGKVSLKADFFDMTLKDGSQVLARGYNKAETTPVMRGYPVGYTTMAGGSVVLQTNNGNLSLEIGSLIDVSGSDLVTTYIKNSPGTPKKFIIASDPGSLTLSYGANLSADGEMRASPKMAGVKGGTLTVKSALSSITLTQGAVDRYLTAGFDDLTFQTISGLVFSGSVDAKIPRRLTLDAPTIKGVGDISVVLSSPWIRLNNTYYPASTAVAPGQARMTFSGDWIDVQGSLTLSGFSSVTLQAAKDIMLSDRFYQTAGQTYLWKGNLDTAGGLMLQADRIYPTTSSQFTVRSAKAVTILPGDGSNPGALYSAGGKLEIFAPYIEHFGFLSAPLGQIVLAGGYNAETKSYTQASKILLGEGSFITTAGAGLVSYGTTDETFWTVPDKASGDSYATLNVEGVPEKSVTVTANEVFAREGSEVNVSGGGAIFSHLFLPSPAGSENPIMKTGRYVIVPDGSMVLPGDAVYLEGGAGIAPGLYSLLPEAFAFLPGALILTDLSKAGQGYTLGQGVSAEGYPVVKGYSAIMGTGVRSPQPKGYSVRKAEDVLKQGSFVIRQLEAGDAGRITLAGSFASIEGTLRLTALPGYRGGSLGLSANAIVVGQGPASPGTLTINPQMFAGMDLEELDVGDLSITNRIIVEGGSVLKGSKVTLAANVGSPEIVLEPGAEIHAVSKYGEGVASLLVPRGKVTLKGGALVHASDEVNLDLIDMALIGDIKVDHSAISLKGAKVFFVPEGYAQSGPGLYLTQSRWQTFNAFENIALKSGSDILFRGDFNLTVSDTLTLDAARIAADPLAPGDSNAWAVVLSAPKMSLLNTGASSSGSTTADSGTITLEAQALSVGHGDVRFDGFASLNLNSKSDVYFSGKGSLTTGGADLNIASPRVTTSFYQDQNTAYEAAKFLVDAGNKAVNISRTSGTPGQGSVPGGLLEIKAGKIALSSTLEVNSGQVKLSASGSAPGDGIFLTDGAQILARGSDYAPGGLVELRTEQGTLTMASGALIDVSAGAQGDAGGISLVAPSGGVLLNGTLVGHARSNSNGLTGEGGSFTLDTKQVSDFGSFETLAGKLWAGGFDGGLSFRVRTGNVDVPTGVTLMANTLKIMADGGDLTLNGVINGGGRDALVELYAWNNLTLNGSINARRASGAGGDVYLSAGHVQSWDTANQGTGEGLLTLSPQASISVDGDAAGKGGTAHLRAYRNGTTSNMNIGGTVTGASEVLVEAVQAYQLSSDNIGSYSSYVVSPPSVSLAGLSTQPGLHGNPGQVKIISGIEIQRNGDLTLNADWDLTGNRPGEQPGVLTLRAGGNLNINANLVDHPTDIWFLFETVGTNSWAFNLIAGADLGSADPMAVKRGSGNLTIGPDNRVNPALAGGKMVYSEGAPIRFASGGDALIRSSAPNGYMFDSSIRYALGSYSGNIQGNVEGTLTLMGGAIQTATGDIGIRVGRDLVLDRATAYEASSVVTMGSIRTTGSASMDWNSFSYQYWNFSGGGNVALEVGGSVKGGVNITDPMYQAWDSPYYQNYFSSEADAWTASYPWTSVDGYRTTEGIATMGGGNIRVRAGGDVFAQIGAFGGIGQGIVPPPGDLNIYAGGNIDGRFLLTNGTGHINAMANIGTAQIKNQAVELFDARMNLLAQGSISLGSVLNPLITHWSFGRLLFPWNLQYSTDSKVKLMAVTGDVSFLGDSIFSALTSTFQGRERLLPPTLEIYAGRDILFSNSLALAPSPIGNLVLQAGRDIVGGSGNGFRSSIVVSDKAPSEVYGIQQYLDLGSLFSSLEHASTPVHAEDPVPVRISAGGDIRDLQLSLPKKAQISAGRDIRDIYYSGQNVNPGDVTLIKANRDLFFSSAPGSHYDTGIVHGGPGSLVVQAGNNVELGTTSGIRTVGSGFNSALGLKGSDLIVLAGIDRDMVPEKMKSFFEELRKAGNEYARLRNSGDIVGAETVAEKARKEIIVPVLGEAGNKSGGDVSMTQSQISATWADDDVYVLARGTINAGKSTFVSDAARQGTGIFTAAGGAINILNGGDLNVNEARVMTFRGGDVTVYALWNQDSAVNAGRGSKTAISVEPPKFIPEYEYVFIDGKQIKRIKRITQVFTPPAVGSGIRTLTYDPDGTEGPLPAPPEGDVYIFANTIDAGEAGIHGRNVTLGAVTVINVQNISFSGGSLGVPAQVQSVNLGALTGTTSITAKSTVTEETVSVAAKSRSVDEATQPIEEIVMKWLEVKVIDFDLSRGVVGEEEPSAKKEDGWKK